MKKTIFSLMVLPIISYAQIDSHFDPNLKGLKIVNKDKTLSIKNDLIETHDVDNYIDFFFSLEGRIKRDKTLTSSKSETTSTGLRSNYNDIKLAIPFIEPIALHNKTIGFAPIGSYKENGWTGIKTFFKDESLGICSYSFERFVYIEIESNYMKNYVHNKPTFTSIEGNKDKGYLYTISWDVSNNDSVYDHKIECANSNHKPEIMEEMIKLANNIDKKDLQ